MHDAGCGNAVCLGQEMLELVFVGEIDADRHHEAIGAYPQGTAIDPLRRATLEMPGQQFKMIGKPNVVMGDKGDQIALRLFEGDVSIGVAEMRRLGQIESSDPRIAESRDKLGRTVGAAVADDEQLEVSLALPEHRLDRITVTSARLCVGNSTLKRGAILEAAIACQAVGDQGRVQRQPIFIGIGVIVWARRKVYGDTVPLTDIDVGVPNKFGNIDQSPVVL